MPEGKGVGEMGGKGEQIKKYKLVITKQSWDVKFSIKNIVNDIVITVDDARSVLALSGESLCKLYNCMTTILCT